MAAAAAARDGQTSLALRLLKHLAPSDDDGGAGAASGNVAFSPVSVHAALALLAAGARGATLAQLLAFLGAPSVPALADFGRSVSHRVLADRADAGGPRVLFGGGVWVEASRAGLADDFRNVAAESYKSEARTVSFIEKPGEAAEMINEWVDKATNGLIKAMISAGDIDAETDLVLANAVYFKAKWLRPFHTNNTGRYAFHCLDGSRAMPETMSMRETLHVACMDGFKVLKLPYVPGERRPAQGRPKRCCRGLNGGCASARATGPPEDDADEDTQYSMFIFLPDALDGIATMVDVITAAPAFLYDVVAEMKEERVDLKLPKFEITFVWDQLKDTLHGLGLSLPFSPKAADLGGMFKDDDDGGVAGSPRPPRFVGKAAHTAVVKVNEKGTEAAAATFFLRGGGYFPEPPLEFFADHPFTFFLMEERSGVIVFAGHVLDPTK